MKQTTFQGKRAILACVLLFILTSVIDARRTRATAEVKPEPETTPLNRKQTVALHHAVKKLLGLKVSPDKMEEGSRGGSHLGRKSNSLLGSPPQYMLDLYNKYKYGAIPHGRHTGNTVRYINAEIGTVGGERVLLFSLSSVATTERVFSAELHLYQRRAPKHADNLVSLRKMAPPAPLADVGSVPLRSRDRGWHATDVTSGVKRCISSNRKSAVRSSLVVSFRRKRRGKKSRALPISRFADESSMPFLVLFSNDTQNITLDHVDPHFRSADLTEEIVDPEFGYDPTLVDGEYRRKQVNDDEDTDYDEDYSEEEDEEDEEDEEEEGEDEEESPGQQGELDDIFNFDGFGDDTTDDDTEVSPSQRSSHKQVLTDAGNKRPARRRRSIHDNEIPESPDQRIHLKPPYNMPLPDSAIFPPRSKGPKVGQKIKVKDNKVKVEPTPGSEITRKDINWDPPTKPGSTSVSAPDAAKIDDTDVDLIPYPDEFVDRRRKNRRRNRRRNRKHGRRRRPHHNERQLPLPPAWEAELRKENLTGRLGDRKGLCGRRKLVVDFADIGWNDWIISPKSFEAHYCAGQCPFPLVKDVRPSNHATIQSLVHVIGIPADVPAPCCVPDEMSSVSLLYFDGNKNVVLKHYPSMSVTSCACR